jgi:hypothetical protein
MPGRYAIGVHQSSSSLGQPSKSEQPLPPPKKDPTFSPRIEGAAPSRGGKAPQSTEVIRDGSPGQEKHQEHLRAQPTDIICDRRKDQPSRRKL